MITVVKPPSKRSTGRRPRLSDEDIKDLADALKAGEWASDSESVGTKTAAYQRAQSARDLVAEALGKEDTDDIKTAVEPVDLDDLSKGYTWKIGPRPEGERPRRRKTS